LEAKIQVREILEKDNTSLAAIIRTSLKEFNANKPGTVYYDETTDHLSDVFKLKNAAYFVLETEGEIAGGSGYYPTKGLPSDTCELVKLYVSKKFRGKGFGQILLDKCMKEAKQSGFQKMYLETMPELTSAIPMYQKNGFHFINSSLGNSGHTGCDVWMLKDL
jgi:putative acetyltransferase